MTKALDKKKLLLLAIIVGVAGMIVGSAILITRLMHLWH